MNSSTDGASSAQEIDAIIKKYPDWRGERLAQIRELIKEADPMVTEEVKYKKPTNPAGVPVWYHDGMICIGETYKAHLRITFSKGPSLQDPKGLLNAFRAILLHEEDTLDEAAFKDLVKNAVKLNTEKK